MKDAKARAAIESHEKVCTERYGNIDRRLETLQTTQTNNATQFHERLNVLSTRMWGFLIASLGATVLGMAALVFYIITTLVGKTP